MTQTQVSTAISNGQYAMATYVNNNYNIVQSGGLPIKTNWIQWFFLSIQGLLFRYNAGDYTSSTAQTLYNRVIQLTGLIIIPPLDGNFEQPNVVINVVGTTPPPLLISWADFVDTGNPGRNTYINAAWKGFNPVLEFVTPAATYLTLGVDYVLLSGGGIQLLSTGNLPFIYEGNVLIAVNYAPV